MLIDNSMSVHQNTAKSYLTYADAAIHAPPPAHVPAKTLVPSKLLDEVTVETIGDPVPQQPSPQVVQAINKARAGTTGKVMAAKCLQRRDVLVTANSPSTKALL